MRYIRFALIRYELHYCRRTPLQDYQKTQHKKTQHRKLNTENSTQKTQHRKLNTENSTEKIQHILSIH